MYNLCNYKTYLMYSVFQSFSGQALSVYSVGKDRKEYRTNICHRICLYTSTFIRLYVYIYYRSRKQSVRQLSLRKIKKETWNLKLLKNSNRGTICEMHDKEHALLHTYYYKNEVWINQKYLHLVVIIEGIVTLLWL